MNTLHASLRLALPLLALLGAPRLASACSLAPSPLTVPGSFGQKVQVPASAPALGVSTKATELVLVGPLAGARTETSPSRVLWTKPTDAAAALPAIESITYSYVGDVAYYVIPVSGLVPGEYELEAKGAGSGTGATKLTITTAAPLPSIPGGVISLATENLKFIPSSNRIDSCDTTRHLTSRHEVATTVALQPDVLPWGQMLYAKGNTEALRLSADAQDGGLKLSGYRSYVCPHASGVQATERELRVFGAGVVAKVKVSDNIPACGAATAQTDGAITPGSNGCSLAPEARNSVWSATLAVALAVLGRRRATAVRHA